MSTKSPTISLPTQMIMLDRTSELADSGDHDRTSSLLFELPTRTAKVKETVLSEVQRREKDSVYNKPTPDILAGFDPPGGVA